MARLYKQCKAEQAINDGWNARKVSDGSPDNIGQQGWSRVLVQIDGAGYAKRDRKKRRDKGQRGGADDGGQDTSRCHAI